MPLKLFHTITYCLLLIAFSANGDVRPEKPNGILLEVKEKSVLGSKTFQALVKSEGLIDGKFYSSQSIQFYRLAPKTEKTTKQLKSLCDTITKKFSLITICEVNLPLKPNQAAQSDENQSCATCVVPTSSNSTLKEFNPYLNHHSKAKCDLFPVKDAKHDYQKTISKKGLSPFWAQEYVGSDLLKEEMKQRKVDTAPTEYKLAVWDSHIEKHGEMVSNLIAGPYASSLVQRPKTIPYVNLHNWNDFFEICENLEKKSQKINAYPRFINNSMGWNKSELAEKAVQKLSEKNVVFITGAANEASNLKDDEPSKASLSSAGHLIVVASHAPNGLSSDFSNFGQDVDITAPSDYHILSFTKNGKPDEFGGTSGATPIVTAALLSFELISGVELSTSQFKALLKKTAIRHRHDPPRQYTGAGYLNTYKIGAIAFRLAKLCAESKSQIEKNSCALEALKKDQTYDFSESISKNITNDFNRSFPECSKGKTTVKNKISTCEEKKSALKAIRKAAFLDTTNGDYWKKLACVSQSTGFALNAEYYQRLADGHRITSNEWPFKEITTADKVELKDDKQFILDEERIKNDKEVVLAAVKSDAGLLKYASDQLKNDKEIVLVAVKSHAWSLEYASKQLKNDKEVVLAALKTNGNALEYASDQLKNDKEVVLTAVNTSGNSFAYASEQIKTDREFVLTAVKVNGIAFQRASKQFKNDKEIVLAAVKYDGWLLNQASDQLKNDREFVLAAVKANGFVFQHASKQFKNDKEIVLTAVKLNGVLLEYASYQLRNDKEVVLAAVNTSGRALEYASDQLKNDKEFIRQVKKLRHRNKENK